MTLSDPSFGDMGWPITTQGKSFHIERMLINSREQGFDVYENKVLVGFVKDIGHVLSALKEEALSTVRADIIAG